MEFCRYGNLSTFVRRNSMVIKTADVCRKFDFTVHKVCEYMERVRISQCVQPYIAMNEWADYLKACDVIGSDLTDKRVKYPSALRTEHDKVMYKKKIIENQDYEEKFQSVVKEYGEKYYPAGDKAVKNLQWKQINGVDQISAYEMNGVKSQPGRMKGSLAPSPRVGQMAARPPRHTPGLCGPLNTVNGAKVWESRWAPGSHVRGEWPSSLGGLPRREGLGAGGEPRAAPGWQS